MESIISINHIIDNIYASSKEIAQDTYILEKYNITVIISLNNIPATYIFDTKDDPNFDIIHICDQIYNIIINTSENILIHCDAGVSRTGTVLIYYVMKKYKYTYQQSYQYVKSKRSVIEPNPGFELSLRLLELEKNINNTHTLTGITFIDYTNLVPLINTHKIDNITIIGIGNGMKYGNHIYLIDNTIDELLESYSEIKKQIDSNSSIIIYGISYLIHLIKNLYYNTYYGLTNEERDKIDGKYLPKSFVLPNILDLEKYTKNQLIQLLVLLDSRKHKDKELKKNMIIKIQDLLLL